jgi:hypothetical protein
MTHQYGNLNDYIAAQQAAFQGQNHAEALEAEVENTKKSGFDDGSLRPILDTRKDGSYQVRIWPIFPKEGPATSKFWFECFLYNAVPEGCRRGFSPRTFGQPDAFSDMIFGAFPYDEDNPMNLNFRNLTARQRVLMLVTVRHLAGYQVGHDNPNEIVVWNLPRKKVGFDNFVADVITKFAQDYGVYPVDPYAGYDACFTVDGKGRDRQMAKGFQFVGSQCPAAPDINAVWKTYFHPEDAYYRLTNEDVQNISDWWEPCVEMALAAPDQFPSIRDMEKWGPAKSKALAWAQGRGGVQMSPGDGPNAANFAPPQPGMMQPPQPPQQSVPTPPPGIPQAPVGVPQAPPQPASIPQPPQAPTPPPQQPQPPQQSQGAPTTPPQPPQGAPTPPQPPQPPQGAPTPPQQPQSAPTMPPPPPGLPTPPGHQSTPMPPPTQTFGQ